MNDAKQKHIMEMIERQNRQFEIVRKGLREAARIMNEINTHLDSVDDLHQSYHETVEAQNFEESSGCVFEDLNIPKPTELELDMEELTRALEAEVIHEVTDDMIVDVAPPYTVENELNRWLYNIQTLKRTRESLH